jgi:hypothetical protein
METMMPVSRHSRKQMKKTGTANTLTILNGGEGILSLEDGSDKTGAGGFDQIWSIGARRAGQPSI